MSVSPYWTGLDSRKLNFKKNFLKGAFYRGMCMFETFIEVSEKIVIMGRVLWSPNLSCSAVMEWQEGVVEMLKRGWKLCEVDIWGMMRLLEDRDGGGGKSFFGDLLINGPVWYTPVVTPFLDYIGWFTPRHPTNLTPKTLFSRTQLPMPGCSVETGEVWRIWPSLVDSIAISHITKTRQLATPFLPDQACRAGHGRA